MVVSRRVGCPIRKQELNIKKSFRQLSAQNNRRLISWRRDRMKWPDHGGQPHKLSSDLQIESSGMLDFSANINPLGPPEWLLKKAEEALKKMSVYPDPEYPEAVKCVAESEGVENGQVLITNGGAEAVYLAARLVSGGAALLIEPSFKEYSRACRHYNIRMEHVPYRSNFAFPYEETKEKLSEVDALFICRPHNPSGTVVPYETICRLAEDTAQYDVRLFIDEAFIDFLPEEEKMTGLIQKYSHVVLLRSLTKIFSVPGLRCGYLLGGKNDTAFLKKEQMAWSVNAVSAALIPPMMQDGDFVRRTVSWLQQEIKWIESRLDPGRWHMSSTHTNFYLLSDRRMEDQEMLIHFLLKEGIAVRHTYNFSGIDGKAVRAAVRSRRENEQLIKALKKWEGRQ
jgi:threonine-phosphate decarboxylase